MNLLFLYRIVHGKKISGFRLLGYTFFGYLIAGIFDFVPLIINTFIVAVGIMIASILNDYYDWKFNGEDNAIGTALNEGRLSKTGLCVAFLAPLLVLVLLIGSLYFFPITKGAVFIIFVNLFLSIAYSIPGLRFKDRPWVGAVAPPLGIFLLFFQGLILLAYPNKLQLMIAFVVFLFAWFLEFLHLVDDAGEPNEVHKITQKNGMRALWIVIVMGVVTGAIFFYYSLIFVVTVFAWMLRARALSRMHAHEIPAARRNIIHPLWQLEEFIVYAIFIAL